MKNPTLLRLAGIGLLGVTFVSPGSVEKKDWLLDELSSVQIFKDLPFTSSAFCQETNYPKKSEDPAVETPYLSVVYTSEVIKTEPAYVTPEPTLKEIPSPGKQRKSTRKKTAWRIAKNNIEISAAPSVSEDSSKDSSAWESLEQEPDNTTLNDPDTTTTVAADTTEETPLPPINYVDEIRKVNSSTPIITRAAETGQDFYPSDLLITRIEKISSLAKESGYSTKYAFLLNLGLKSGKKRFLIIDLETDSIVSSGLVAHGRGKEKFTLDKKYSNIYGSSCSSLGLYKIGSAYNGDFGKSFRLIGLEQTNSNALNRAIVLHSMNCIPDVETDYPICQSEGCPSVSPAFLQEIIRVIKLTDKPILLWAFDPTIDENLSP